MTAAHARAAQELGAGWGLQAALSCTAAHCASAGACQPVILPQPVSCEHMWSVHATCVHVSSTRASSRVGPAHSPRLLAAFLKTWAQCSFDMTKLCSGQTGLPRVLPVHATTVQHPHEYLALAKCSALWLDIEAKSSKLPDNEAGCLRDMHLWTSAQARLHCDH